MFYGGGPPRVGVAVHVNSNAVANKPLHTHRYRMLTETPDGLRRPFMAGDPCAPGRSGKQRPNRRETPDHLYELLDWVDNEYPALLAGGGNKMRPRVEASGTRGVPVRVVKTLPATESEALAAISHEVLQLSTHQGQSVLLIEGHDTIARTWSSKYGSLAPQVCINILNHEGRGVAP